MHIALLSNHVNLTVAKWHWETIYNLVFILLLNIFHQKAETRSELNDFKSQDFKIYVLGVSSNDNAKLLDDLKIMI